ncbi:hypothetical protein [Jiangella ureilytica]|uniref:hypothetical protein n=1 Tax=Jiangella ureilytica TaxID=2530374 RepID=UPI0013A5CE51|nr:hypothetical protein [Jiangella ureilytica]
MRVFVTGATGFVGAARALRERSVRDLLGRLPEGPSIEADLAEGTYRRLLPQ